MTVIYATIALCGLIASNQVACVVALMWVLGWEAVTLEPHRVQPYFSRRQVAGMEALGLDEAIAAASLGHPPVAVALSAATASLLGFPLFALGCSIMGTDYDAEPWTTYGVDDVEALEDDGEPVFADPLDFVLWHRRQFAVHVVWYRAEQSRKEQIDIWRQALDLPVPENS